ncbi:MAG TPA: hypothetical protein VK081_12180, partial [Planctomycetota bacterium]|nr:hypothetical protein [Planctomycetota bacterium]
GVLQGAIDLRFTTGIRDTGLLGVRPVRGGLGLPDPYLVKPGDPLNSVVLHRMARLDGTRMPILGSNVVDRDGLMLLIEWVRGL